ncbi:hypothetical protein KEM52_001058 [Ascosphaera acerosa]|nr:hypothetical protein KEM52_001058 [Ascosphaera acerosa]
MELRDFSIQALQRLNDARSLALLDGDVRTTVVAVLAAFATTPASSTETASSTGYPWATPMSATLARHILEAIDAAHPSQSMPLTVQSAVSVLPPVFRKDRSQAITAAGRKAEFRLPRSRFDGSLYSMEAKPWKKEAFWVVAVAEYVARGCYAPPRDADAQQQRQAAAALEQILLQLIPAVLAMIDDGAVVYKTKGCELLALLLRHVRQAGSEFLRRTNLSDVLADALEPCLTYLPTLSTEAESTLLLSRAYPALYRLVEARFQQEPRTPADESARAQLLGRILHRGIVQAFRHTAALDPAAGATMSSFPHPALSALLLDQVPSVTALLGPLTIAWLQELLPLVVATLSNPFVTADLRLAHSAVEALRAIVLAGWPRIHRWRGEVCAGLTDAWIRLHEQFGPDGGESGGVDVNADTSRQVGRLRQNLRETLAITRIAAQETIDVAGHPDESQFEFTRDDGEARLADEEKRRRPREEPFDAALRRMAAADDRLDGLVGWVLKEDKVTVPAPVPQAHAQGQGQGQAT